MITVQATGRLTKEPQLRYTNENGVAVANFTLACKRNRPNKEGETETTFLQCVLWGNPAEVLGKYVHKGNLIAVHGELQNRSFDDRQGVTRYVTSLLVENFEFLEKKKTSQENENMEK